MNRPTPETDAAASRLMCNVSSDFARKLKYERDEALSQIVQAECRAERFCQERDEAREKAERYRIEANAMMMQRDEAREELRTAVQERHDFHWELQDAIRERDEAREEINRYREKLDLLPISWDV